MRPILNIALFSVNLAIGAYHTDNHLLSAYEQGRPAAAAILASATGSKPSAFQADSFQHRF